MHTLYADCILLSPDFLRLHPLYIRAQSLEVVKPTGGSHHPLLWSGQIFPSEYEDTGGYCCRSHVQNISICRHFIRSFSLDRSLSSS